VCRRVRVDVLDADDRCCARSVSLSVLNILSIRTTYKKPRLSMAAIVNFSLFLIWRFHRITKGMTAQAKSVVIEHAVTKYDKRTMMAPLEQVPADGSHVAFSGLHCNNTVIIAMNP
jgi:hypothetical protein